MNSHRALVVLRWLLAAGAIVGIVLVYRVWLHVNQTTVALTFLLLVLVLAAEWGLRYAVVASIVAAACYNYFFLPPFYTFTIADTQNWLALSAFFATAIIASHLSQKVRDEADEARLRQKELYTLFRLSRELLQSESVVALLSALPATVVEITSAKSGYLFLIEGSRIYQIGSTLVSSVELPHLARMAGSLTNARRDGEDLRIPIRSGVRPRGLLVLCATQLSNETADSVASLISLALDRAQALENLAKGDAAKENERLRTLMIDSITHELRTPLTSIKGAATALLSGGTTGNDERELLSIIDEESDRLNRLVSEAVQVSQLDAQQVRMHLKTENVCDLAEKASDACGWVKTQHSLRIDVPASLKVVADKMFLQKVLCNLLENAAKYSEPGAPIVLSAEESKGKVLISVSDRGTGVEEAEQSLIFERFYRSRFHTTGASGTGMGLAISRAIIHAHGGKITVVSQLARGSVFTISLPSIPS